MTGQGLLQLALYVVVLVALVKPFIQAQRETIFEGERYNFCSDGCQYIFDHEPVKYRQAWLPVHQIYQGNCGAADLPGVLQWYSVS